MLPSRYRLWDARIAKFTRREGFSLVELLVVIAIVGLLISLLLPAVQAARESARRMTCTSNLHQIGIGLHGYHDSYQHFPQGGIEVRTLRGSDGKLLYPNGRQLGWTAFLLPFVELQSLAKRIDYRKAFDSVENAPAAAEVLPLYLCPSTVRQTYSYKKRGVCDYGGIFGETLVGKNNPPTGIMVYTQQIRIRDIIDGASHTMIVSEDCSHPEFMQWINGENVFSVDCRINSFKAIENDINSKHKGGANGLMADGSSRFLSVEMNLGVLAAICTRNGKESVSDF
jgi:prepilin-type N-terminal cleavage/methylation domain-containing protein/prepilin-type processing-associated H-X9-DG protein